MSNTSPFSQRFEELPAILPVFPLAGAVVLPGGHLPLNIFEPRYLNMVRDAMRGDQLIGMIQPLDDNDVPALHRIGGAGRIIRYEESDDGRLGIVLAGLCRFAVADEIVSTRGYRQVQPDWRPFASDYDEPATPDKQSVLLFTGALRNYFQKNQLETDWSALENLETADLLSSLISYLPVTPSDKQILLEAETLDARLTAFTAILSEEQADSTLRH